MSELNGLNAGRLSAFWLAVVFADIATSVGMKAASGDKGPATVVEGRLFQIPIREFKLLLALFVRVLQIPAD